MMWFKGSRCLHEVRGVPEKSCNIFLRVLEDIQGFFEVPGHLNEIQGILYEVRGSILQNVRRRRWKNRKEKRTVE